MVAAVFGRGKGDGVGGWDKGRAAFLFLCAGRLFCLVSTLQRVRRQPEGWTPNADGANRQPKGWTPNADGANRQPEGWTPNGDGANRQPKGWTPNADGATDSVKAGHRTGTGSLHAASIFASCRCAARGYRVGRMNPLSNIRVVLVRPTYGGNLGSVCRAMKNMDITRLAVVQPDASLDFGAAQQMAMHAVDVLEKREQFDSLADAVKNCQRVYGTTARKGLYRSHCKSPREWAPALIGEAAAGEVAVVFGTEDSGLANEELAMCTNVIRIPSSTWYSSLNLSQAVLICCYEIFLANGHYEPPQEFHPEAPHAMRERFFSIWRGLMTEIGFFGADTSEHMMMAFRRIFARGKLSEADANIMMGVARQMQWKMRNPEIRGQKSEISEEKTESGEGNR